MPDPLFYPPFEPVCPPDWSDRPCAIVGTGPSLKGFDFERLRGPWRVLAVKEAMHDLPFADCIHGVDFPWMMARNKELAARAAAGIEVLLSAPAQGCLPGIEVAGARWAVRARACDGMSSEPSTLESGSHSGYSALNIAWHRRPPVVVLFGYDYGAGHYNQAVYDARGGGTLWAKYAPRWVNNFNGLQKRFVSRSIQVFNASPKSNLHEFEKVTHDRAIDLLHWVGCAGG